MNALLTLVLGKRGGSKVVEEELLDIWRSLCVDLILTVYNDLVPTLRFKGQTIRRCLNSQEEGQGS